MHDQLARVTTLATETLTDAVTGKAEAAQAQTIAIAAMQTEWRAFFAKAQTDAARARAVDAAALRKELTARAATAQADAAKARADAAQARADAAQARADAAQARADAAKARADAAEAKVAVAFFQQELPRCKTLLNLHEAKDTAVTVARGRATKPSEDELRRGHMQAMGGAVNADANSLQHVVHATAMPAFVGASMAHTLARRGFADDAGGRSVSTILNALPCLVEFEAAARSAAWLALTKGVSSDNVHAAASLAAECVADGGDAAYAAARVQVFLGPKHACADAELPVGAAGCGLLASDPGRCCSS